MHIWVDADACPAVIKEILFRAAVRVRVPLTLAAAVVEGGATALDPRGELYGPENIGEHLSRRNFMDELRSAGQLTGGPAPFGAGDQKAFARQLDRLLARLPRPAA